MFTASTTALMGTELLRMYPDFRTDYAKFDREVPSFFFQMPRLLIRNAYARRKKILDKLTAWNSAMLAQCGGEAADPQGEAWEPVFGSRVNRARQKYYAEKGMEMRSRAGMDLGWIFALSSNSITAAGWMLMHILNPDDESGLKRRIMDELHSAKNDDGSLHIATLISLPLLQSIWQEVIHFFFASFDGWLIELGLTAV